MPLFKNQEEANEYYSKRAEIFLKNIESAKTPEERWNLYSSFISSEFDVEEQPLKEVPIKNYQEYQEIKKVVFPFLSQIEKSHGINIFEEVYKDQFEIDILQHKLELITLLLNTIDKVDSKLKPYLILNLFRTSYEINLKQIKTILTAVLLHTNQKPFSDKYFWDIFLRTFNFKESSTIKDFFKNDLRNPIAHEDWLVLDEKNVLMKDKNSIQKHNIDELGYEIHKLFFLRVALTKYVMESNLKFAKSKLQTPEDVDNLIEGFKQSLLKINKKE